MNLFLERLRRALAPDYTVAHQVGAGGMGTVFLGRDVSLDVPIAIKVMRPEQLTEDGKARFRREAQILARLRHPNIVVVHHAGERDGMPFYAMDYLEGSSLKDRLARGRLPLEDAERIALGLLSALAAAHRADVVHRDVKPGNVILVNGRPVLVDFGIAKARSTGGSDTASGTKMGTERYMAPEQSRAMQVTARADVYAAGVTLYETYAGKDWPADSEPNWAGVPPRVARVLQRAVQLDPQRRWADAGRFLEALEVGKQTARPPGGWITWGAGAVAVAVAVAVLRGPKPPPSPPPPPPVAALAIYPFGTNTPADPSLGRDVARLAAFELESFHRVRLVPWDQSTRWWDQTHAGLQLASIPARVSVQGTVLLRNDSLAVQLEIADSVGRPLARPTLLAATKSALGDSVAKAALRQVLPTDSFVPTPELARLPLPALDAYLDGEEAFEHDQWQQAELDFAKALALDPGFARAAWRLWIVQNWRRVPTTVDLSRLLAEHADRLSDLHRLQIEAWRTHAGSARHAVFERALASHPGNAQTLLFLGAELFHRGPLTGIELDSGVTVLEEAVAHDPALSPAEDQAIWGEIRLGRQVQAAAALERMQRNAYRHEQSEVDPASTLQLAYIARFRPAEFERTAAGSPQSPQLVRALRLALSLDIPNAQLELGRQLLRAPDPAVRANGHEAMGLALVALGRGTAAIAQFDTAAALFATPEATLQSLEWRLIPAALGLWDLPASEQDSARRGLAPLARGIGPTADRAAWALGLDRLAHTEISGAESWHAVLRGLSSRSTSAARLSRLLAAAIQAQKGDYDAALAGAEPLLLDDALQDSTERLVLGDRFARTALHYLRGQWFTHVGRPAQAEKSWLWYENSDFEGWPATEAQAAEIDWAFGTVGRLRRAEAELASGERQRACAHLKRIIELWSAPDATTAPAANQARQLAARCPR